MIPELWLDETNAQVHQKNVVTGCTYQFNSPADAKKGHAIIYKTIEKCLKGRNRRPFYPDFAIEECKKKGIEVFILF